MSPLTYIKNLMLMINRRKKSRDKTKEKEEKNAWIKRLNRIWKCTIFIIDDDNNKVGIIQLVETKAAQNNVEFYLAQIKNMMVRNLYKFGKLSYISR